MSKLEELLKELCPKGVEYKELGEIIQYEQPGKYIVNSTEYSDEFDIPVLTAGQSFILGYTDESEGVYQASQAEPVIIFDDFTTSSHWVDFPFKIKSSAMKLLTAADESQYSLRYCYYCMETIQYVPGEHSRQWISKYSHFKIPVPPLPVQQKIVRDLDAFTGVIANIESELALRRKQYEYYRDKLLAFKEA